MKPEPTTLKSNTSISKWLRHSGASIVLSLNPLYWKAWPWWRREHNEWASPNERTWSMGFLGLTIRVWIDNGDW
jgi:hypothetical protein